MSCMIFSDVGVMGGWLLVGALSTYVNLCFAAMSSCSS